MTRAGRYRLVRVPGHPRGGTQGIVYEHVVIAEKALGRFLPDGVEIHHVNENGRDNTPGNLVICQNRAYHKLLHQRADALAACGNPSWLQCCYCHRHDNPSLLKSAKSGPTGRRYYHPKCAAKYVRERKRRLRES